MKTIATVKTGKNTVHKIQRAGRRKDQGGDGVTWSCSCGVGCANDSRRACWPMIALWRDMLKDENVKLTAFGRRILKRGDQ